MENMNMENVRLKFERKTYKGKDGKEYWSYFVAGKVRNRDVRVDFATKDPGGYEVLDLLFEISPNIELSMHEEEMTNELGKTMAYTVYEVKAIDEDGVVYSCKVKPQRDSDKALLGMLLNQMRAKA